jgi:hypothetical protein
MDDRQQSGVSSSGSPQSVVASALERLSAETAAYLLDPTPRLLRATVTVCNRLSELPELRLLVAPEPLARLRERFLPANAAANLTERGAVRLARYDGPERLPALAAAEPPTALRFVDDEPAAETLTGGVELSRCQSLWADAPRVGLQTPARRRLTAGLADRFPSGVVATFGAVAAAAAGRGDLRRSSDASSSTSSGASSSASSGASSSAFSGASRGAFGDDEPRVCRLTTATDGFDPVGAVLLAAATEGCRNDRVTDWVTESRLAAASTVSERKQRLAAHGVIRVVPVGGERTHRLQTTPAYTDCGPRALLGVLDRL